MAAFWRSRERRSADERPANYAALWPSPLVGEGGAQRRKRGVLASNADFSIWGGHTPLPSRARGAIHLLPQGEKVRKEVRLLIALMLSSQHSPNLLLALRIAQGARSRILRGFRLMPQVLSPGAGL
jgi:hypothetical protein